MSFWNPLTKWKNLKDNPNVVIRRNVDSFSELYAEVEKQIDFLSNFAQNRKKAEDELVSISNTINNIKSNSTNSRSKKNVQILNNVSSLMSRQKKILEEQKKAISKNNIYAKDTIKNIKSLIHLIYSLNISILTLLHRERIDADNLIAKVKASKGLPSHVKVQLVRYLNHVKLEVKGVAKRMYDSYQYQERSVSNPLESFRELSPMFTRVKCRKIRHLSVQIDTYESYVQGQLSNLRVGVIPQLIQMYWIPQIKDIAIMSENHVNILSHRVRKKIHNVVKNESLKKDCKNMLRKVVSQASYLVNSIKIEEFKSSSNIIPFRKQVEKFKSGPSNVISFRKDENKKEIRKAA